MDTKRRRCGVVYRKSGELNRALDDYDQASQLDPKMAAPFLNRGIVYTKLEQWKKAFAEFGQAVLLDPESPSAFYNRGFAHVTRGENSVQAIADLSGVIRLMPDRLDAYYARGVAHIKTGQCSRAVSDVDRVVSSKENGAGTLSGTLLYRGYAQELRGHEKEARADYNKALERGNRDPWLLEKLQGLGASPRWDL